MIKLEDTENKLLYLCHTDMYVTDIRSNTSLPRLVQTA